MHKTIVHPTYQTIAYQVEGPTSSSTTANTPAVVLIHGFAEDANVWQLQTEALKASHRLIIPDLPGCGQSAPLSGPITMEAAADIIKAIIDAENINTCTIIGHSMGGYITLAFMDRYSKHLTAAGFVHSTANPDTEEKKASRRKCIEFIKEYGAASFISQTTPNLFAEENRKARPELVGNIIQQYSGFDPNSLIAYYEAMIQRPDRTQLLSTFTKPFLFILGRHDNAVPIDSVLPQTWKPALSYIHILEHAGHMGMHEQPGPVNKFLEDFLHDIKNYNE